MSSSVTSCQLLVPSKSGVEEQNNQDVGGDDKVTKENVPCMSLKAYLPNFFTSGFLSRLWKVVSLLLNFLLIVVSFYWSYMASFLE
ncbi:hypothetical protein Ocin01_09088 [Orchesella cincta]|uniref:Uncharacterized protein n=1 Tax=Orchesella cincta TaxID=48709 RepID=A0A1D2MX00_ORCCI|nr:hypothetical protein Ocin01_09088 [Orchesella cincta]